jgi:toxin ParE1/3/4
LTRYRLLPAAEADIGKIVADIALDNPGAARRWLADMVERCRKLGDMPGMGRAIPEISPDLRLFPAGNYLVLYRHDGKVVDIVRVLHGARQWQNLFRDPLLPE